MLCCYFCLHHLCSVDVENRSHRSLRIQQQSLLFYPNECWDACLRNATQDSGTHTHTHAEDSLLDMLDHLVQLQMFTTKQRRLEYIEAN